MVLLSNTDQNVGSGALTRLVLPPRANAAPEPARRAQEAMKPPTPRGLAALAASAAFFGELQSGKVNQSKLSDDYRAFLTSARLAAAAEGSENP